MLELKTLITEIKNSYRSSPAGLAGRIKKMTELKDRPMKTIQSEGQKYKRIKNEQSLRNI